MCRRRTLRTRAAHGRSPCMTSKAPFPRTKKSFARETRSLSTPGGPRCSRLSPRVTTRATPRRAAPCANGQWRRGVRLFGIDAPDLDPPGSYTNQPFSPGNHRMLLGSNVYIIENLGGQVASLLGRRVLLIPAPMKVGGEYASGAPVRLVAMTQP